MKKRFRKQCLTVVLAVMLMATFSAIAADTAEQPPEIEHDHDVLVFDGVDHFCIEEAPIMNLSATAACTSHKSDTWIIQGNYHYKICTVCATQFELSTHSLSYHAKDSSTHLAICACGYQANNSHSLGSWITTESSHYKLCSICSMAVSYGAHSNSAWYNSGASHWKQCSTCGLTYSKTSHSFNRVGEKLVCSVCGHTEYDMSPESADLPEIEQAPDSADVTEDIQTPDSTDLNEDEQAPNSTDLQEKDQTPEFAGLPEDIQIPAND